MLYLLDVVFEYWSPSKEIRYQIQLQNAFIGLCFMKNCLDRDSQKYYIEELKLFQPCAFDDCFSARQLYQQFIDFFGAYRYEGKTFKEALDLVKNDICWYR